MYPRRSVKRIVSGFGGSSKSLACGEHIRKITVPDFKSLTIDKLLAVYRAAIRDYRPNCPKAVVTLVERCEDEIKRRCVA
jgi:hypothetical protein